MNHTYFNNVSRKLKVVGIHNLLNQQCKTRNLESIKEKKTKKKSQFWKSASTIDDQPNSNWQTQQNPKFLQGTKEETTLTFVHRDGAKRLTLVSVHTKNDEEDDFNGNTKNVLKPKMPESVDLWNWVKTKSRDEVEEKRICDSSTRMRGGKNQWVICPNRSVYCSKPI